MSKLVAIEWDSAELRIVVGRTRGTEVVVEHAAVAELPRKDEEADVGPHLAALLNQLQVGRSEVLIAIGRTNIELRKLQMPPAPEEELPDMVRFQAMRQFTSIGDDWPIDYVPLQQNEAGVEVLAAALSPTIVQQIRTTCTALELTPKCLALRPFAAASLLMRANPSESRCCLVVDLLATEADLFVLLDGNVAFLRTIRLPDAEHGSAALVAAMVNEVRRTIAAAQSQMSGRRIDAIVLFADQDRHAELRATLGNQLSLPVETVNPFTAVIAAGDLERQLPEHPGRYAPLLGMILDEAAETRHRIDFLHPRKRPAPKTRRTQYLAGAAAATLLFCLIAFGINWMLAQRDAEVAQLRESNDAMKDPVAAAQKRMSDLKELESFLAGNTPWLTELERISASMPPAKDAMVTQFTGNVQQSGEARVVIEGVVNSESHASALESRLRDDDHRVTPGNVTPETKLTDYKFRFADVMIVQPVDPSTVLTELEKAAEEKTDEEESTETVKSASDAPTSSSNSPAEGTRS